ncbi:MAG: quinone-dependent dihydroorotate dehydrogenase [Sporichthyaceae bacterium]
MYEKTLRRALFASGDAETAHNRTLSALAALGGSAAGRAALARVPRPSNPRTVFGVRFPNAVGLAAGMDKNAVAIPAWGALGFGFAEVGTVTWHPQPGNPEPRMFRLAESKAIINRMGFNNGGAQAMAARLEQLGPAPIPLGISLGKSKITPVTEATGDYLASLKVLLPYADYIAVNVSSPNTPGLRDLQDKAALDELLAELRAHTVGAAGVRGPTPLLVKIAPDLSDTAIAEVLEVCLARGVAGIIATNTTITRAGLRPSDVVKSAEAGGLSGRPVHAMAVRTVAFVTNEAGDALPVIGVGGILDPADGTRMFDAGARLVQLYTGFVYGGPGLVRRIARGAT